MVIVDLGLGSEIRVGHWNGLSGYEMMIWCDLTESPERIASSNTIDRFLIPWGDADNKIRWPYPPPPFGVTNVSFSTFRLPRPHFPCFFSGYATEYSIKRERDGADTGIAKFAGVVKDTVEKLESDDSKDNDHKQHQ